MNKTRIQILKQELNIDLNSDKALIFDKYARIFLEKNSRINLVSKNDEKFLFEKHVFDSLAINLLPSPLAANPLLGEPASLRREGAGLPTERVIQVRGNSNNKQTLLDIGTGGGFPAIPLAILYENLDIYPLDSIRKKIAIIEEMKSELSLKNLHPVCDRVENIEQKFDYVTSRAVSSLDKILKLAVPKLKKGGYFIAYKSKNAPEELKEAEKTIKRLKVKVLDIIEYTLPLEEVFERNLIVFQVN